MARSVSPQHPAPTAEETDVKGTQTPLESLLHPLIAPSEKAHAEVSIFTLCLRLPWKMLSSLLDKLSGGPGQSLVSLSLLLTGSCPSWCVASALAEPILSLSLPTAPLSPSHSSPWTSDPWCPER